MKDFLTPPARFDIFHSTEPEPGTLRTDPIERGLTAPQVATRLRALAADARADAVTALITRWDGIRIEYGCDTDCFDVEPAREADPGTAARHLLPVMLAARWPTTRFTLAPATGVGRLRIRWRDGPIPATVRAFAVQEPLRAPFHPWTQGIGCERQLSPRAWACLAAFAENTYGIRIPRAGTDDVDWSAAAAQDLHGSPVTATAQADVLRCTVAEMLRAQADLTAFVHS